jgi:Fungal domain of unknown function (DUF1746)
MLHIFTSLPAAAEESNGYLYGGIMVDFIGQKAPTSKLSLLLLDLTILVVQSLMLAAHSEREKIRSALRPTRQRANTGDTEEGGESSSSVAEPSLYPLGTQDHDAEERGVLRDIPDPTTDEADIELQPLNRNYGNSGGDSREERNSLLNGMLSRPNAKLHLPEVVSSGNAVLGDFHILHTLRTAATDYENTTAHSIQTLGYTATLAALTTRRAAEVSRGST